MAAVFALYKVFPFGNRIIMIHDLNHQYYPFFSSLWHKLRDGSLSAWSWTAGAGHDYIAHIAYYLASPLNLIALLLPYAWLRETITLIVLIKIGCAGLFTSIFLRYTFKQNNISLPVFSSLYALCAFVLGYFYNIIWLDGVALLPLVMTGVLAFMREGKFKLYIVSLFLAVFTNFYMGFFICIFTVIAFFTICFLQKLSLKDFFYKLKLLAIYSIISIGMAAVLLIPAFSALQNAFGTEAGFPSIIFLVDNYFDILGNFIAFIPPTYLDGFPNVSCGMVCILLAGIYIASPKVSMREKVWLTAIFVFFLLCCNVNVLYYIMHGFRYTNNLPYRFSFFISFLLIIFAFRAFLLLDTIRLKDLWAAFLCAFLFIIFALLGSKESISIIVSAIFCVLYLLIIYLLIKLKNKAVIKIVFLAVILIEISLTAWNSFAAADRVTRLYPGNYKQMQAILHNRQSGDNDFYRTEKVFYETANDTSLYNFNGIALFSTMLDKNTTGFIRKFGLQASGTKTHSLSYYFTTPFVNSFLNIRYLICTGGVPVDEGIFWNINFKIGDTYLLENMYHLPLGFMVNNEITDIFKAPFLKQDSNNIFLINNAIFSSAAGLDGDLFLTTDYKKPVSHINYKMPRRGMLYIHTESIIPDKISIFLNDVLIHEMNLGAHTPIINAVEIFNEGDIIDIRSENNTIINAACFNIDLFEQGYALLEDEPLILTHFSGTKVKGSVKALKDGILYTSIPGRNWSVRVDGIKTKALLIDNAMLAVSLTQGAHEIEFYYHNKSFTIGIIISILSLAAFILLILNNKNKR